MCIGSYATGALRDATRSLPIVFQAVPDPVAAGYVANLAHPGGNATGFVFMEYGVSGKWPGLLKEVAPGLKRVAVLRDPAIASGITSSLGLEIIPLGMADAAEIERSITRPACRIAVSS